MSSFHQAGIHPSTLEFNFAQQPIIQPSPVQDVISILEKHLAEQDRLEQEQSKETVKTNLTDAESIDEPNKDEDAHQKEGVSSQNKLDAEKTSEDEKNDVNLNLKYVVVDQNGAPDWTKVLNLDKNIIKEVCKKHDINIDDLLSGKLAGESRAEKFKSTKSKKGQWSRVQSDNESFKNIFKRKQ